MKILYIGFNHRINDPRLFYRQMQVLKKKQPHSEIFFLSRCALYNLASCFDVDGKIKEDEVSAIVLDYEKRMSRPLIGKLRLLNLLYIPKLIMEAVRLRPTIVQASDIREILFALLLRILTHARIVYDAHEDYFNQIYEYSGKSGVALFYAWLMSCIEILSLRHFSAIFGADDYVVGKYSQKKYRCKEIYLLRNYPMVSNAFTKSSYTSENRLNLVYVGGVNKYRGVIECAEYVSLFNKENDLGLTLVFTVYSPRNQIVENLLKNDLITYREWMDYMSLMRRLARYDIGVCLWHPLDKFKNNLPLKNFDYMSVGLPILTSNFGNLKIYAERSGAALCIDPFSYAEFKHAIYKLANANLRRSLGENGLRYVKSVANFENEAEKYLAKLMSIEGKVDIGK